jgi:hypothetical protein
MMYAAAIDIRTLAPSRELGPVELVWRGPVAMWSVQLIEYATSSECGYTVRTEFNTVQDFLAWLD